MIHLVRIAGFSFVSWATISTTGMETETRSLDGRRTTRALGRYYSLCDPARLLDLGLTAGGILAYSACRSLMTSTSTAATSGYASLWPGHADEEVEGYITIPIEKELNGIARVTFLRSISNFGLSNIRVLFADDNENYWARQQVQADITEER